MPLTILYLFCGCNSTTFDGGDSSSSSRFKKCSTSSKLLSHHVIRTCSVNTIEIDHCILSIIQLQIRVAYKKVKEREFLKLPPISIATTLTHSSNNKRHLLYDFFFRSLHKKYEDQPSHHFRIPHRQFVFGA